MNATFGHFQPSTDVFKFSRRKGTRNGTRRRTLSPAWSAWALAEADRIDPVISGACRTHPAERDSLATETDSVLKGK
jgi:hypothetical protein